MADGVGINQSKVLPGHQSPRHGGFSRTNASDQTNNRQTGERFRVHGTKPSEKNYIMENWGRGLGWASESNRDMGDNPETTIRCDFGMLQSVRYQKYDRG